MAFCTLTVSSRSRSMMYISFLLLIVVIIILCNGTDCFSPEDIENSQLGPINRAFEQVKDDLSLVDQEEEPKQFQNHKHHHHRHHQNHHRSHQLRHQIRYSRPLNYKTNRQQDRKARAVYLAQLDSTTNQQDSNNNKKLNYSQNLPPPPQISNYYQNDQPFVLDQCCACDEAKYELVFEGLWSRYTHPDDFPENYWLAAFSDIIGASHSNEFRMWNQDSYATEGVKELAETGTTKKLESELKLVSTQTRTIIKARELRYPTLNSKTSAVFRTDRLHHLVSILSKLSPSPDWMVGVSGLELCQSDCSWAPQRVVNLYLWDAGTDSGITFTAPKSPTRPQEKIHPFKKVTQASLAASLAAAAAAAAASASTTTSRPDFSMAYESSNYQKRSNYEQSQVFSGPYSVADLAANVESAFSLEQSKPYARLTITRQRIYEKTCNGNESFPSSSSSAASSSQTRSPLHNTYPTPADSWPETTHSPSDCRVTDWSDWSTCSSTCGKGLRSRIRSFVDERANSNACPGTLLIEKEICRSECFNGTTCVTKEWSEWSKCSVTCGQGFRKRTRSLISPYRKPPCDSVILFEKEPCTGSQEPNCHEDLTDCEVTEWSQWSKCSNPCGEGTRHRTRRYLRKESAQNCSAKLIQKQSCTGKREDCKDARDNCNQPMNVGPCLASFQRWYYDKTKNLCMRFNYGGCLGNENNFHCLQDCEITCLWRKKDASYVHATNQTTTNTKWQSYSMDQN